jgi:hypothetical protein
MKIIYPKVKISNEMCLGVYTCAYVLLSLILKLNNFFWINHVNTKSSYLLIMLMDNVRFIQWCHCRIYMWNFISMNCIVDLEKHWIANATDDIFMIKYDIEFFGSGHCTLYMIYEWSILTMSLLIIIWKLPMA